MFASIIFIVLAFCSLSQAGATMEVVPVGNTGNVGEWSGENCGGEGPARLCGAVDYRYSIGKYEVTARQYAEFLNAAAETDSYGLYNLEMWSNDRGCKIQRSGLSGSYSYTVATDWANRPVNYVSWGDAARFANWMHNGRGSGSTETGSYNLNGALTDTELMTVQRDPDATWVIPSEDEWYKAAYHKNNGATGDYFDYPTSSDTTPNNDVTDPDSGNSATFYNSCGDYTIGEPYYRTEVGEHENSPSPYGTFDQGGNIFELNETIIGESRVMRGGSWGNLEYRQLASNRYCKTPSSEIESIGFRLAYIPEPASLALLAMGSLGIFIRKSR